MAGASAPFLSKCVFYSVFNDTWKRKGADFMVEIRFSDSLEGSQRYPLEKGLNFNVNVIGG